MSTCTVYKIIKFPHLTRVGLSFTFIKWTDKALDIAFINLYIEVVPHTRLTVHMTTV